MTTGLYPFRRQTAVRAEQRFSFERGTPVRVYVRDKVFPSGPLKGQPMYFDGLVNECIPAGIVIRGRFMTKTMSGHKKGCKNCETICGRFHTEDIDRVEVRQESAGET